jgi:hypothetical protein
MAQNFGEDSTQGSILVTFMTQVSGEVVLADADGNSLLSFIPEKSYNSVVISCPEIAADGSYTVTCGTESTTVEMDGLIYGDSGMMGGMDRGGMNRGDKNQNGMGQDGKNPGSMGQDGRNPDDMDQDGDFDPSQMGDMPQDGDFDPSQMGDMPQDSNFDPSQKNDATKSQ